MSKVILLILIISAQNIWADTDNCVENGFSSLWEFNQKEETIQLTDVYPMKVCNHFSKMVNSNIRIDLLKGKSIIHSIEVLWPERVVIENFEKDQPIADIKKIKDTKIIKFPLDPKSVDSYKVYHLKKNKLLSEGAVE